MTRLLDNLSEAQNDKVSFLRLEKWRCRDTATDNELFRLGDQLIDILGGKTNEFAQAATKGDNQKKEGINENTCGMKHYNNSTHSGNDCYSNPKNANKPEVQRYSKKKSQ